jgi:hypothetical protein
MEAPHSQAAAKKQLGLGQSSPEIVGQRQESYRQPSEGIHRRPARQMGEAGIVTSTSPRHRILRATHHDTHISPPWILLLFASILGFFAHIFDRGAVVVGAGVGAGVRAGVVTLPSHELPLFDELPDAIAVTVAFANLGNVKSLGATTHPSLAAPHTVHIWL